MGKKMEKKNWFGKMKFFLPFEMILGKKNFFHRLDVVVDDDDDITPFKTKRTVADTNEKWKVFFQEQFIKKLINFFEWKFIIWWLFMIVGWIFGCLDFKLNTHTQTDRKDYHFFLVYGQWFFLTKKNVNHHQWMIIDRMKNDQSIDRLNRTTANKEKKCRSNFSLLKTFFFFQILFIETFFWKDFFPKKKNERRETNICRFEKKRVTSENWKNERKFLSEKKFSDNKNKNIIQV